jgi:ppGpp synthetase/RelA/SpoT-type nucleotidyltranferase
MITEIIEYYKGDAEAIERRIRDVYDIGHEEALIIMANYQVPIQETWLEQEHPRDKDGRFAQKGEDADFTDRYDFNPSVSIPDTLSNSTTFLKQKWVEKAQQYIQFDELQGNPKKLEQIRDTPEPNDYHRATAYAVLQSYPEMDENFAIQQSWRADKVRAIHEAAFAENNQKLQNIMSNIPNAQVYGRIKARNKMLDKMGRKSKYKDVTDMGDVSGFRSIVENIDQVYEAMDLMRAAHNSGQINILNTDNKIETPLAGYRAIHYDIVNADGTMSEFQLKTPNQAKWADHFHDSLYKYDKNTEIGRQTEENLPDLVDYSLQMSEYFYEQDLGNTNVEKPQCPQVVMRIIGCL